MVKNQSPIGFANVTVQPFSLWRSQTRWEATIGMISLSGSEEWALRASELLGPEEARRYASFSVRRRQLSFLSGRLCAKAALSHLLDERDPQSIEVRSGVFNQPIVFCNHRRPVGVSIAHCDQGAAA